MVRVVIAGTQKSLTAFIGSLSGYEVVGQVERKKDIIPFLLENPADMLIAMNGLAGDESLNDILLGVKKNFPKTRIVLLAGEVDFEIPANAKDYDRLVSAGIYDIYCEGKMSKTILMNLLNHPRTYEDVEYIHEYVLSGNSYASSGTDSNEDQGYIPASNNTVVFSSSKAGSGKSFISTNVAAMIARFGRPKSDYQPPTVLIVEGDLQTLSVGTLYGISNHQYTIKSALKKIRTVVNSEGEVIGDENEQAEVNEFIKKCCLQLSSDIPNLYGMVGSSFPMEEINLVSPYHFFYLLGIVSSLFDVVIIDANSALEHRTTGPVMQLARQIFMVVMDEYDSVKITNRFKKEFANLGISEKTKYILNKCMTKAYCVGKEESTDFNAENYLDPKLIVAKVPYIDQIKAYNHIYNSKPIAFDESFETLGARIAFTQIANKIWPMTNDKILAAEVDELEKAVTGKGPKK